MKSKFLLVLLASALSFSSYAQLEINPNPVYVNDFSLQMIDVVAHSMLLNQSDETKIFQWSRNVIEIPAGWTSAVCDNVQCHFVSVNNAVYAPVGAGEEATLDVHVYPDGTPGSAIIEVLVFEQGNQGNSVVGTYYFNSVTSVGERLTNAISIYPNPVNDVLFIENNTEVHRMDFFTADGKQVESKMVMGKNSVEVGNLAPGNYIVRMHNRDGVQISSNLLLKR